MHRRKENPFGHPSLGRMVEGGNVYLTSKWGTIEIINGSKRLWVRTER